MRRPHLRSSSSSARSILAATLARRARARRLGWAAAALLGALAWLGAMVDGPRCAHAYVRARTQDTDAAYFWYDPRQILELASPQSGTGITEADFRTAAARALATWSHPTIADTVASFQLSESSVDDQEAKRDGHNRIILRTGAWCRDPVGMTDCHDPAQLALTTWFVRSHPGQPDDGEILEADIEVNTVDHDFAIIPDGMVSARDYLDHYDLVSVLTHESGHFLGLAHNCRGENDPLLLDDTGALSPECLTPAAEVPAILLGTMYPMMDPIDVHQRTLTADDIRAVCDIYPPGSLPVDDWVGKLSCSIADAREGGRVGSPAVGLLAIAALAVAVVLSRRRRPRPRGARWGWRRPGLLTLPVASDRTRLSTRVLCAQQHCETIEDPQARGTAHR